MLHNTYKRAAIAMFMLCLVFVFMAAPFSAPAQADPLTIIIVVVLAAGTAVVVDAMSCGFNIFFYCDSRSGGQGGNGNDNNGGTPIGGNRGGNGGRPGGNGSGSGSGSGGSGAQACASAATNACKMHGTGFIVNGVCNATPPPNSACPAPVIGSKGFYANPSSVRSGETTKLYWDVTNATTCSLTGGGLSGLLNLAIQNLLGQSTNTISEKTIFTLSCQNGAGGPTASQQTTVNLVPSFQEI